MTHDTRTHHLPPSLPKCSLFSADLFTTLTLSAECCLSSNSWVPSLNTPPCQCTRACAIIHVVSWWGKICMYRHQVVGVINGDNGSCDCGQSSFAKHKTMFTLIFIDRNLANRAIYNTNLANIVTHFQHFFGQKVRNENIILNKIFYWNYFSLIKIANFLEFMFG